MVNKEVRKWLEDMKYSTEEGARVVGLSLSAFRKQLYGERPLGQQTIVIMNLIIDIVDDLGVVPRSKMLDPANEIYDR
jgi:hypothetical protein